MIFKFWKRKASRVLEMREIDSALQEAEYALSSAHAQKQEAKHLADSLFKSRQENHYAQRIRAAYQMETR